MSGHWIAPKGMFNNTDDVTSVFSTIYDKQIWGGGSGQGSDIDRAQDYVQFLQRFLINNFVRSVVDIGCGDWRFSRHIDWGKATYRGIDVVQSVVEENTRQFTKPNISFAHTNPLDDQFEAPRGDLVLMKDVLQHLSNANVLKMLTIARKYKFALITNDYARINVDCNNGDTRPLELRADPFNVKNAPVVLVFKNKATYLMVNA